MRSIISALVVLVMMFTMVSISEAGFFWWSPYRCGIESPAYTDYIDARAIPCPAEVSVKKPNTPVNAWARDANLMGSNPTGTPHP
ncbi:MAG: hypothetical protein ACLQVJ_11120 [Syntrophobacteraceae bacterium]